MNVVATFPTDMDARTQYKLMKSPSVKKMADAEGSILEVAAWIAYTDIDSKTGEEHEVLTIQTVDGELFGTISATFRREFSDIVKYFGDDVGAIKVVGGKSKAGRNFITCTVE